MLGSLNRTLRKHWLAVYRALERLGAFRYDKDFEAADVPLSTRINHSNWINHLVEIGNHDGRRVLEVGSREVTGPSVLRNKLSKAQYVGFDYYPGPNVDVVGDAHQLTRYFDERFDIIVSSAVFEHFAMPWVVAVEMAGLLKIGGFIFVETHFSFSSHERPWHFFQFSDLGLKALFSPSLGFRCIEAGMSNPIVGRFSSRADHYLRGRPVHGLYCHAEYLGEKVRDVSGFDWQNLSVDELVGSTRYPAPSHMRIGR